LKKIALQPIAGVFAAIACALAIAGTPPTEAPTMKFRVLPSETKLPSSTHTVMPYRMNDLILVVVNDPVRCGQNPVKPSFELKSETLQLRYDLTPAEPGAAACTLVTEFTILNAPHKDVTVAFSGGPEPASVAAMQKCPKYNPKTDDVFECLMPTPNVSTK
jgi:hypothetical protein